MTDNKRYLRILLIDIQRTEREISGNLEQKVKSREETVLFYRTEY